MRRGRNLALAAMCLGPLLAVAPRSAGGEGVVPINQVCAVHTGCFPGDTPGFPVTIDGSAGSSYRLAGDLVVPDASTTAIDIEAGGVSIDLAGFRIVRADCAGTDDCSPAGGGGRGIRGLADGISIAHGAVVGTGGGGVHLGRNARVEDLRVYRSGGWGIEVGEGSVVIGSVAERNLGGGIRAVGGGSVVAGDAALGNGDAAPPGTGADGIRAGEGSVVVESRAEFNKSAGIVVGFGSVVVGNTAHENGEDGIEGRGVIARNAARRNGRDGIAINSASAHGNTASFSGRYNLFVGSQNAYFENYTEGNGNNDVFTGAFGGSDTGANF